MKKPIVNQPSLKDQLAQRFNSIASGEPDNPWKSKPVTIREFVVSREHMNFPTITPKQLDTLVALLGEDPLTMFESRQFQTGVFLCGKGSGKDMLSVFSMCYVVYVLEHLKDPQKYLFKANVISESIDLLNVAPSAEMASLVFFEKFKKTLKAWKWLKQNYRIKTSGKEINPTAKMESLNYVSINLREVIFPNNIRCFSRHSDNELSEGFSIIFSVMDEASAFMDPDAVFNTLRSSSDSRFPNAYRVFILSWPRHAEQDDFTCRMANQAQIDQDIYVMRGATWEILPKSKFCGQTFIYNSEKGPIQVPVEYEKHFLVDPVDAMKKYAAIAPKVSGGRFYTMPEKIHSCVDKNRQPIAEYSDFIIRAPTGDERIGKELVKFNIPRQPDVFKYFAIIDYGLTKDSATLAVGHEQDNIAIQDLIVEWIPDRIHKRPVDLDNVVQVILQLKAQLVNIVFAGADQFQSAQAIQSLQNAGINAAKVSVNKSIHESVRGLIYTNRVSLLDDTTLISQLENLTDHGNKISAPLKGKNMPEGSKLLEAMYRDDKAIATIGLVHTLIGPKAGVVQKAADFESAIQNVGDDAFSGMVLHAKLH